ncbi:DPP IV N-terminal domain-containing protein [Aquimarina sp. AU58]|uniref:TolB family protein n=1 Tax=Aquimarina sp. AU58 TaxID=1874112 RepID=UPI000D6E047D|nr:DPP IV N-terminal domain-containing protein [Aquimarina sp. AU58]
MNLLKTTFLFCLITIVGYSQSKILFARKQGNDRGWSILSIDPNDSSEKTVIPYSSGMGEYNPDISPDGKTILFNTYRYGGWKLAIHDLTTTSTKKFSHSSSYYTNGVFSPKGDMIVYEKNVGRNTHIFIADKNGKNEVILTKNMSEENRIPVWSADGRYIIFYSNKNGVNDIYSIALKSKKVTNLTNNISGNDFAPSVSPDGKYIAFFSDRNGYLDLYRMDITGTNQINLTNTLQSTYNRYNYYKDRNMYWRFKSSWSPDGSAIVFTNIATNNFDLFITKIDGNDIQQITNSSSSEYTPVWAILHSGIRE